VTGHLGGPPGTSGQTAARAPLAVQRGSYSPGVTQATTPDLIRSVIDEQSLADLRFLHRRDPEFREVTAADRLTMIKVALDRKWVADEEERIVEDLWKSFGSDLRAKALANLNLWKRSHAAGADLQDLELFAGLKNSFADDVNDIVLLNLAANEEIVQKEWTQFSGVGTGPQPSWKSKAEELRKTAKLVKQAQEVLWALRRIHVGYREMEVSASDHVGSTGWAGSKRKMVEVAAVFDPDKPPEKGPRGDETSPMAPYGQIKDIHETLSSKVEAYATENPTIYLLIKNGDLDRVADDSWMAGLDDVDLARTTAMQALDSARLSIRQTRTRIETPGSIGFEAFVPVHKQLLGGRRGKSGVQWNQPLESWLASAALTEVREGKALGDILASLGTGALFCVATMASGGLATLGLAGGIALTGQQLGEKWGDMAKLQAARGTGVQASLESVSQSDASAAGFEFVLNAIFAVIDIFGAAKPFLAARAAAAPGIAGALAAKEAGMGLKDIGSLAPQAQRELVQRSVGEQGVGPALATLPPDFKDWDLIIDAIPPALRMTALRSIDLVPPAARLSFLERAVLQGSWSEISQRSGIPVPQLMSMFSRAEELAGRRSSLAFGLWPSGRVGEVTTNGADEVLRSVNDIGAERTLHAYGGWDRIAELAGEQSEAGKLIMAWRDDHVGKEFRAFVESLDGSAIRTGTKGKEFSNDFDWNFLGPNGARNRDLAASWLVNRLGMPEDQLRQFVKADLFVDPRRLHRYDALGPAARAEAIAAQTKITQEQVYARLLEQAKTPEARLKVINERDAQGIAEAHLVRIDPADIKRLELHLDDLEAQLAGASKPADQARIAKEISMEQGLINASKGGAYTSGGGGRRGVSARPGDELPGYRPGDSPPDMLQAEWYADALDQLPFLHKEVGAIRAAAGNPAKLALAIRNAAKFQKRMGAATVGSGVKQGEALFARFEAVASRLDELVASSYQQAGATGDMAQAFARTFGEAEDLLTIVEKLNLDALVDLKRRALAELGVTELRGDGLALYQELIMARLESMEANRLLRETFFNVITAIQLGRPAWTLFAGSPEPPPP